MLLSHLLTRNKEIARSPHRCLRHALQRPRALARPDALPIGFLRERLQCEAALPAGNRFPAGIALGIALSSVQRGEPVESMQFLRDYEVGTVRVVIPEGD